MEPNKILPAFEIETSSVDVGERVRNDFGDVQDLVESIRTVGLIQPIVVTAAHKLVAGERRLRAHRALGMATIKAVYIEVLDEGHKTILEATENLVRKDFDWKEVVLAIDKVHRLKTNENALQGEAWGVRETGRLLNSAKSNIGRAVFIAGYLRANDPQITTADNLKDAYAILLKRKEDELSAALVKQSTPKAQVVALKKEVRDIADEEFFAAGGTTGFTPGISSPIESDETPSGSDTGSTTEVPLSKMFFHADAVTFCKNQPAASYDSVITDWPYGIEMSNIQQDGGGKDVSLTASEHGVEDNEQLQRDIIPELYRLLRSNGWFITWTDASVWSRNCTVAEAAGFKVQRWPLVWHKTSSCQNMAAQYNFTKNFEVALVCRKGNATLLRPQASSVWSGGNEAESKALGHPFAKPFALWEWIYAATCLRGATVLDPFVGCGSSTIPAIRFGLRPTGVEVNEKHFASLNVNLMNFYKSLDPTCTFS